MRLPQRIFEKSYFFLFAWLCFGELLALLTPGQEAFIYYHSLMAFIPSAGLFYDLALGRALINLVCLLPLFLYSFSVKRDWTWFFRPLLIVRVVADIAGHNYEWQFLKALYHTGTYLPLAAFSVWVGLTFLSYKAHFICAFKSGEN